MKSIIIVVILLLISVCGYCQSPGDRKITSEGFKYFVDTKVLEELLQKSATQAQLDSSNKPTEQEQKVLEIKKESEPICVEISKDKSNKEESTFICILKAIFLGGKFPGESDEQYKLRLQISTLPAVQPYK